MLAGLGAGNHCSTGGKLIDAAPNPFFSSLEAWESWFRNVPTNKALASFGAGEQWVAGAEVLGFGFLGSWV